MPRPPTTSAGHNARRDHDARHRTHAIARPLAGGGEPCLWGAPGAARGQPDDRAGTLRGSPGTGTALARARCSPRSRAFTLRARAASRSSATMRRVGRRVALRTLGVVFQARALDLDLSVTQNLAYHAALHGPRPARGAAARRGAAGAHRAGRPGRRQGARALGGQTRRVEIARASPASPPAFGARRADGRARRRGPRRHLSPTSSPARGRGRRQHRLMGHPPDGRSGRWWTTSLPHRGQVLARGTSADIAAQAGASDIRGALPV